MRTPSTCRSSLEASGLACYVWGCHLLALYVRTAWGGGGSTQVITGEWEAVMIMHTCTLAAMYVCVCHCSRMTNCFLCVCHV